MISHDQFRAIADRIPYQYRHPFFLYSLVRWLQPKTVVEIGTHLGMSAVWMARGVQENGDGHLWCIDPFCWVNESQEEQWHNNILACGVQDHVTLIKGRSEEVEWPAKIDMAFIDGNHTYPVCKYDTEKAVALGARIIAIHDTVSWEGSRKYADEIRTTWKDWDFLEAMFDEGMLIGIRRDPKGECRGFDIGEQWDKPTKK
jgi:predicted O-methyltransferase YrrM